MDFKDLGFYPADILLPEVGDMTKWSVVACDQYTSEPEYWEALDKEIADAPSTLRVVLPEVYLDAGDVDSRIAGSIGQMKRYIDGGIFKEYKNSFIYLERTQANGKVRRGLVGMIDLEDYSFVPGDGTLIRATEGTILSRIPPRIKVRRDAIIELPHIMLLLDDRDDVLIGPLQAGKDSLVKVYDFTLNGGGGHVEGRLVNDADLDGVADALRILTDKESFKKKYNVDDEHVLLFAVGDGNHSLATAKTHYENIKRNNPNYVNHPARYALVEVVNIHDEALEFEPIHRVVFDIEPAKLLSAIKAENEGVGNGYEVEYLYSGSSGTIYLDSEKSGLPVGVLQDFIDRYLAENGGRVDYIHGDEALERLSRNEGCIGFLLPPIEKSSMFKGVISDGVLPRKTFSMGHAHDKRYYLEARMIRDNASM